MIKKCLFPVAGYGTRFLPATKAIPKEMLPVVNKPLIQYGVEEAFAAGMSEITFVTSRIKRAIEDHFDTNYELEHKIRGTSIESSLGDVNSLISACNFTYTRQKKIAGLGHAILSGASLIGREPFGVILADDLCSENDNTSLIGHMMSIYEKTGCSVVAIQQVPIENVSMYGVVRCKPLKRNDDFVIHSITDLIEKPSIADAPSDLAVIGRYILTPDIFDLLNDTPPGKNGEIQLTDALRNLAINGRLLGYHFSGKRFDCGTIDGYVSATNYYYNTSRKRKR